MRKILCLTLTVFAITLFGASGAVQADQPAPDATTIVTPEIEGPTSTLETENPNEPLFVQEEPPVEQCGLVVCPPGMECCNASCGICVEPGGACIQIVCEHPGEQNQP